jgi:UDPglucose 6-dehydrogenase
MKHIFVAGAGHVGLVSAICYANKGNLVSIYDSDRDRLDAVASGKAPFFEPRLHALLAKVRKAGHLNVPCDSIVAAAESDFCFVAVGTPTRRDGSADLSSLLDACRDIALGIRESSKYKILAIRSTVPPGTTSSAVRKTVEKLSRKQAGRDFGLIVYPEFLREGSAIHDMEYPARVVLGELDDRSGSAMEKLVRRFHASRVPPVLRVSLSTAEVIKYASNAFIATKIAFINEIANLCERFEGMDVRQVADGMGYDPRIGRASLDAGLGFGGPCLPKDLRAFVEMARRNGIRLLIAEAAFMSNKLQPSRPIRLAKGLIGDLKGKQAAVLGLAFKPGTNDVREAPSLQVVRSLLDAGMHVSVYDPAAMKMSEQYLGNSVRYTESVRECLRGAVCCFIVTEWDEFSAIPSELFMRIMARPLVIDGRRVLDPRKLDRRITYRAVGLGARHGTSSSRVGTKS